MTGRVNPDHYLHLPECLASAWSLLECGVRERKISAHTPVLATAGLDGAPQIRTVVLRGCDSQDRTLAIHTDRRSVKVGELRANPHAGVHVYDPQQKIQLRLRCHAELHLADGDAMAAWARTRPLSRYCYQSDVAPGSEVEDPATRACDPSASNDGVDNFMLVRLRVVQLEWLYLNSRGHRRARFDWTDGHLKAWWLAP